MANEITLNFRFDCINGTYVPGAINISGLQIDQAAQGEAGGVVSVTTGDTITLSKTGLTDPGVLYLRNVDATTTKVILWGFTTDTLHCELRSDEFAFIRPTTAAVVYAIQSVGAGVAKMHYRWLED